MLLRRDPIYIKVNSISKDDNASRHCSSRLDVIQRREHEHFILKKKNQEKTCYDNLLGFERRSLAKISYIANLIYQIQFVESTKQINN